MKSVPNYYVFTVLQYLLFVVTFLPVVHPVILEFLDDSLLPLYLLQQLRLTMVQLRQLLCYGAFKMNLA